MLTPRITIGCKKGASTDSVVIVTSVPCVFHHNQSCTPLDTSTGANRITSSATTTIARRPIRSRVLVTIRGFVNSAKLATEKLCCLGYHLHPVVASIVRRFAGEHHLQQLSSVNPTFQLLLQRCFGLGREFGFSRFSARQLRQSGELALHISR